jgi:pyrimidine-nucleoside phosphorylase
MLPQELIFKKRNGATLTRGELAAFFEGYTGGSVSDAQMSALLMAVFHAGMDFEETAALTELYLASGSRLDLGDIPSKLVDKHSTGGVGDKTSLLIAPIVAAAGVSVPMISGRGLGHTGGTLDKLESIPGFRTDLDATRFREVLRSTGMAMMGQTDDIVPLDRRIYALRDVTATIDILPFIAASIMSKKIAGGAQALVLDVKTGNGAFMEDEDRARELAALLCRVGTQFGLQTMGFITSMEQPLGRAIGNWLEVVEVVDCLRGLPSPDLMEVTYTLAGAMIHLGKKAANTGEGVEVAKEMVRSGLAYRKFLDLVSAQGGDNAYVEDTLRYPLAKAATEVHATRNGVLAQIDARALGVLAARLGAGRIAMGDTIDPTAGIVLDRAVGDAVEEGDVVCRLFSTAQRDLAAFREEASTAFRYSDRVAEQAPLIRCMFDEHGFHSWPQHAEQEA